MNEDDCKLWDVQCHAGQLASAAVGDAIQNFANAVMEMVGTAIASLGTVWLYIGTPNLTDGSGGSSISAGTTPPGAAGLVTALGYTKWICLALAAVAIVVLGMRIAASLRRGEGAMHVGRLGLIAGGVVLISSAGALVGGLLPSGPRGAGGATAFIQSGLWWYMGALAVLSVILGGARMVWENRADPGFDVIKSLFTLLVVAGAGVMFTQLFIAASDSFAIWFLQQSLKCDPGGDKACFGKNIGTLLAFSAAGGPMGAMLVIILGIIASLAAFLQIMLMVLRSGALVILAGILPISAAATNTEMGKQWFKKSIGWLVAFLLYKPAAAIVYATAFQLAGTDIFNAEDVLVSILTGLMLMILAVVALPALMRFVTPLVSSVGGGSGGGALAAAGMAALPTGAAQAGKLIGGHGGGSPSGNSSSAPSGAAAGSNGQTAPSGATGAGGSSGAPGTSQQGSTGANGQAGSTGAAAATGSGGTGAAAQAASGGGSAAAASGAAGGAAAAGGPVGMAVAAGAAKVSQAGQAAASAARGATQDVTGEGGPSGSNG